MARHEGYWFAYGETSQRNIDSNLGIIKFVLVFFLHRMSPITLTDNTLIRTNIKQQQKKKKKNKNKVERKSI